MRECDAWDALDSCASVLKTLAASVLPFSASPQQSTFKIVSSVCEDELVLSCDPAEVVDAHGLDMVAVELLREAMDGLAAAHFGRREQARLVVLGAALLTEAAELRRSGLSVWTLQSGLRCAAVIAETAIEKLRVGIPRSFKIHIAENDIAGLGDADDVSWFFTAIEEPHKTDSEVGVAACQPGSSVAVCYDPSASDVNDICAELCRRHRGPVESQHCFVYGRQKLVRQPTMRLFRGIACRVPQHYVSGPSGIMRQLTIAKEMATVRKQFFRSVCLDADLVSAAYDSCAPPQRRTKEQVFQNAGTLLPSGLRERQQVSEAIRMLAERGTEALLVSGEVSDAASELCRIEGLLLVGGLPARLLHALAKDLEAEVLHGLPALPPAIDTPEVPPWQARHALRVELVDRECSRCDFVFPLLGYRQPLLPHQTHQSSTADELVDPFWELWAAADGGMPAASIVLLESSCEPQLRQLHAELHDTFLQQLGSQQGSGKVDNNWIVKTAEALEESAVSADFPALMTANEQEPSLAPWLHRQGDLTGNHAGCRAMASAMRQVAAAEADYCTRCCGDGAEEDANLEPETGLAALAVLQRGTRLVEVILSLDEAQLWPTRKTAGLFYALLQTLRGFAACESEVWNSHWQCACWQHGLLLPHEVRHRGQPDGMKR